MEADGLITRHKGTGRSKVEVELTEKGLDVFNQSLRNETDRRMFSVLTKKERETLASTLFKVRGKVLQDLGIPTGISTSRSTPTAGRGSTSSTVSGRAGAIDFCNPAR